MRFGFYILLLLARPVFADPPPHANGLTYQEFCQVYAKTALKVDLFKAIWAADPDAILYGGTSRDFAYYVLRQLSGATSRHALNLVIENLQRRTQIEARDFVMRESDVDVVTSRNLPINPADYAVTKIDMIDSARLNPDSVRGRTEVDQGFIPVEKIALTRTGPKTLPQFGDGLAELFEGHLTIHFTPPEIFYRTYYAELFLNHPILLALRFLRLLAADEFNRYGKGFPRREIKDLISAEDAKKIQKIIESALNSRELDPYLAQEKFTRWLNQTIRKAYRSYSNATLANQLMLHFRVNELPQRYSGIKFLNNLLFARSWDEDLIAANLKKYDLDPKKFYRNLEEAFPGRNAYHGARNEHIHNAMIYQGVIPSGGGSAGPGQYVWNEPYKKNASSWMGSGNWVVVETLRPTTRVVSIRSGIGLEMLAKFDHDLEAMVEAFGIDIVEYPYSPQAFVIKNSDVVENIQGLYYSVLTYDKAMELIASVDDGPKLRGALKQIAASRLSYPEKQMVLKRLPIKIYCEDVVNEKMMENMDAGSVLLLMEAVVDRFQLPRLFHEAKVQLQTKAFLEVLTYSGLVIDKSNLSPDLLLQLLSFLDQPAEFKAILPNVMRRVNEPEIFAYILSLLKLAPNSPLRMGLNQALVSLQSQDFDVPWSRELLKGSELEDLRQFKGAEKMWLAHSFLKSGVETAMAFAALGDEIRDIRVVRHRTESELRNSRGIIADLRRMKTPERVEWRDGLKQIALIFKGYAHEPSVIRALLNILPVLNQPDFVLELMAAVPLRVFAEHADANERRQLFSTYLEIFNFLKPKLLAQSDNHAQIRQNFQVILAKDPDIVIASSTQENLREWVTQQSLLDVRLDHASAESIVALRDQLQDGNSAFLRLFAANTLFTSHLESEAALGALVKLIKSFNVKSSGVFLSKQLIFTFDSYVAMIREIFRKAEQSNELSLAGVEALTHLKALPPEYEDSELDVEFEALKLIIGIKQAGENGQEFLLKAITDPNRPRTARLTAGKALQISGYSTLELRNSIAYALHMLELRTRPRRFKLLREPYDPKRFFSANDHLNFHLYRLLRIADPEFDEFLLSQTHEGALASLSPVQVAGTLKELRETNPAYLPFITRFLGKTGAKNMPLFFETLVQNYPDHLREILTALFVARNIPEIFTSYATTLVEHALKNPGLIEKLELARKQRLIPLRQQITVEGMYLDDWLKSERDQECAKTLSVAG